MAISLGISDPKRVSRPYNEFLLDLFQSVEITLGSVHPFPLTHRGDAPGPEFAFAVSSRVGRHSQAIAFVEDLELLYFARHSINFKVYVSESLP